MADKVIDLRPRTFSIEYAAIEEYGLDPYAGWVYVLILSHANKHSREAFPGLRRLAKMARMSKPKLIEAIATLEEKGLIQVDRVKEDGSKENAVNHYYILQATSPESKNWVEIGGQRNLPPKQNVVNNAAHVVSDIDSNIKEESVSKDTDNVIPLDEPSPRKELHKATQAAMQYKDGTAYGLIEKYVNFLIGSVPEKDKRGKANGEFHAYQIRPALTADEIGGWGLWMKAKYSNLDPLRKPETINDYVARFRADPKHADYVKQYKNGGKRDYVPVEERTSALHGVKLVS